MKMAFGIFARDLKALLRNPIAALVVGALLILPGLYAWYCIVANWDPYANTGNVPIAIVNNDKGAESELTGKLDIGEQLVSKLKSNDAIDWRFYDNEEEALEDTRYSLCYATIVLPDDLSERIVGIFEGSKDPPTIYYYPNEKYNAVATKVCDSAAQTDGLLFLVDKARFMWYACCITNTMKEKCIINLLCDDLIMRRLL